MSRPSNVVSLPLRTMLLASIRSLTPRAAPDTAETAAEIAAFPAARARQPSQRFELGSVDWAMGVVTEDRRLSYAVVDTRKRLHRLVRETLPRPVFTPAGAGYEHVTLVMARQILTFRARNLGLEERKLAEAVEGYDAARAEWESARRQLAVTSGLDGLLAEWTAVRRDARRAYAILRDAGIDPLHPKA
ncbi:MAG: hypothetical protein ACM30I_08220 [Gemmatimonas sp.]